MSSLTQPARERVAVIVCREGRGWQAQIATLGTVRARSLARLDRRVKEAAGIRPVEYQFHTGNAELDRLVLQIRAARSEAQRLEARAHQLTIRALAIPSGGPVRDLGILLDISHQRVHQLLRRAMESRD
jgi:hypothetical protein